MQKLRTFGVQKIYMVGDIVQPADFEKAQQHPSWLKVIAYNPTTRLYQLAKPLTRNQVVEELIGNAIGRRSVNLKMRYEDIMNKRNVIVDPGDLDMSNITLCMALQALEKEGFLASSIDTYGALIYRLKGVFETPPLTRLDRDG